MSDIKIDIPDITVSIIPDHEYITSVTPSEVYQVNVNVGDVYSVNLQQPDIIAVNGSSSVYDMAQLAGYAFYAGTASFSQTASFIEKGTVESASYAGFAASASYTIGVVSSASYAISSSYVIGTVTSASYALTASYVSGAEAEWSNISNKPSGLVSSSQQTVSNINNQNIQPATVTSSIQSSQIQINTESSNLYLSGAVVVGVYNETRLVNAAFPVSKFSGALIEYTAQRTTDIRSGIIMASWISDSITYTDVSNSDIGSTEDISFNFIKIGSDIRLRAVSVGSGSGAWTVQFLFKLFPNLL